MLLKLLLIFIIINICNILISSPAVTAAAPAATSPSPVSPQQPQQLNPIPTTQKPLHYVSPQPQPQPRSGQQPPQPPPSSSSSSSSPPKTQPSQTSSLPSNSRTRGAPKVCSSVHIRNDLKSFEQLRGCNIIDGPLTVALVSNSKQPYEQKDYDNITFPDLTEVTEYLLFFRVQGLSTLTRLFPNLAVIRGKELVQNYALVIYEMMHLQKIHLPRLSDILRGSVLIESNPNLCYASTVNWEGICKAPLDKVTIKDNNKRCNDRCPDNCEQWNATYHALTQALDDRLLGRKQTIRTRQELIEHNVRELDNGNLTFCWSGQSCQNLCQKEDGIGRPLTPDGKCCSAQCAGGCYQEERTDSCVACRSVSQEDKCVEHCDSSLYEYKGKCINEQACILMVEQVLQSQCSGRIGDQQSTSNLKAIRTANDKHGRCQVSCPTGYEEDPTNKNKCKLCDNAKCRKVCTPTQDSNKPFMITNAQSLKELSGCNVINGSVEISLKGGKQILTELETAFKDLEEISGYLKITRSYPLVTFGFLSRLKAINGSELDRGQYSLIIIDNPNLQELFMFNNSDNSQKQLNILKGKIFVHLNPKLCPERINNLKNYASVADWDLGDVSLHTNGDKEACNTEVLGVQLKKGSANIAWITFDNYVKKMADPRSLLYYLINYREAAEGTVTMFDGRDGCNSQNDVWITVEVPPIQPKPKDPNNPSRGDTQDVPIIVKPATRYALYVKTFTIRADAKGAMSDIMYFETAPDTPGMPKHIESISSAHNSISVNWSPPSRPNGVIESYTITVTKTAELEDYQYLDTCDSIDNRDKITQSLTKEESKHPALLPTIPDSNVTSEFQLGKVAGETCSKSLEVADVESHVESIAIQDTIIDIIYLRQPCPTTSSPKNVKRKRSIEHDEYESTSRPKSQLFESKESNMIKDIPIPTNKNVKQQVLKFDPARNETAFTVKVDKSEQKNKLSYPIEGLEHFSLYTIEVVACHGPFSRNNTFLPPKYKNCSLQAITQVRTLAVEEYDRIHSQSIAFSPANETSSDNIITWKRPERPNGLILAYRVRFRPKHSNSDTWTLSCINNTAFNRDGGFILNDVAPGVYLFSVQAVSMYHGKGIWSEPALEFEIAQNYLISPVVLFLLIIFGLVSLILAVASGTYYYQKKRHEFNNGLIYASVNPDYIKYDPDEWEVDRSNLKVGDKIGTGSFGLVFKGLLTTQKGTIECAIKTVPVDSTLKQRMDFLREASIMKQFDTYHVVKLMGVISASNPVYVIMEYMPNGDLKTYLRRQRDVCQKEKKSLIGGLFLMAAQIADGMAYLASLKFVHRDLAARNCMVGEDRVVKVADFGLSRDIYSNDYYRRDTHGPLPVRWMAPESLKDNLYTTASDVWSYGIVVWEMVTFGAHPYQGLANEEVTPRVIQGHTMSRPEGCPDKLYQIMERCWRKSSRERPSFNDIIECLLPDTEDKLYPHCFYRKQKTDGDSIPQPYSDENTGTESYPLLSYPSNHANGLTNGVNHVQSNIDEKKVPLA